MRDKSFQLLIESFTDKYKAAYKKLHGTGKSKVLRYVQPVFKRWYYSTLIDQTVLSPDNILSVQHKEAEQAPPPVVYGPAILSEKSGYSLKGFKVKLLSYSAQDHPVVADLRQFLNYCAASITLNSQDEPVNSDVDAITPMLSLCDPYYVTYLCAIAFELRLLHKMPSICTNKACTTTLADTFFDSATSDIIHTIIEATLQIASAKLLETIHAPSTILGRDGLLSALQNPQNVDAIFAKIYASIGVDLNRLWRLYDKEQDEELLDYDYMMLCSTYCLGVTLDQWFVTPFSAYLKMIRPLYFLCYQFEQELGDLYDDISNNSETSPALFSPCAYYSLTPLGEVFLNKGNKGRDIQSLTKALTSDDVKEIILYDTLRSEQQTEPETCTTIYQAKVKFQKDKRYWKLIEVAEFNTLHEFHKEICEAFGYDEIAAYSFFMEEVGNKFFEYSSPYMKSKTKKADRFRFEDLAFVQKQKFYYIYDKSLNMEVEIMRKNNACRLGEQYYPRTVRQSKFMSEDENRYF